MDGGMDGYLDVCGGVFGGQGDGACDCEGCEEDGGEGGELHGCGCFVRILDVVVSWVLGLIIVVGSGFGPFMSNAISIVPLRRGIVVSLRRCSQFCVVASLHRGIIVSLHRCIAVHNFIRLNRN